MGTLHTSTELWQTEVCRWYLTGPSGITGLARPHPPQLPLALAETASASMPHKDLGTSVIALRDTVAIPTSKVTKDAQVSLYQSDA